MNTHPAADLFPRMTEDELRAFAADIKANGLQQAIVVTEDGAVLDGRNRLAACKLVRIEPYFETYTGPDPWAYVVAANAQRRHLNKSQLALIAAETLPYFEKEANRRQTSGKKLAKGAVRGRATELAGKAFGVSSEYVRQAKVLLDEGSDHLVGIRNGDHGASVSSVSFAYSFTKEHRRKVRKNRDEAVATAKALADKRAAEEQRQEKRRKQFAEDMARAEVAMAAPADLRAQVEMGVLEPAQALEEAQERRVDAELVIEPAMRLAARLREVDDLDDLAQRVATAYDELHAPEDHEPGVLRSAGETLIRLADLWEGMR